MLRVMWKLHAVGGLYASATNNSRQTLCFRVATRPSGRLSVNIYFAWRDLCVYWRNFDETGHKISSREWEPPNRSRFVAKVLRMSGNVGNHSWFKFYRLSIAFRSEDIRAWVACRHKTTRKYVVLGPTFSQGKPQILPHFRTCEKI